MEIGIPLVLGVMAFLFSIKFLLRVLGGNKDDEEFEEGKQLIGWEIEDKEKDIYAEELKKFPEKELPKCEITEEEFNRSEFD